MDRDTSDFEYEETLEAPEEEPQEIEPEPPADEEPAEGPEPEPEPPPLRQPPVTGAPPPEAMELYNRKLNSLQDLWIKRSSIIQKMIPKHVDLERLFVVAIGAISRNPQLMVCTEISLLRSMIIGSQLGLDVSGVGGMGYLVPYRNNRTSETEATFIAGYRGLIDLATRSGKVVAMWAREIYENDDFEYEDGIEFKLSHLPITKPNQPRGALIGAWSVAQFVGGLRRPEVMSLEDMKLVMQSSKARDKGPWSSHSAQMFRKTVIRRHCKTLPWSSEDLGYALAVEDAAEAGNPIILQELEGAPMLPEATAPEAATPNALAATRPPASARAREVLQKMDEKRRGRPPGSKNKAK